MGYNEAEVIFLGCLKISWTDPPYAYVLSAPPLGHLPGCILNPLSTQDGPANRVPFWAENSVKGFHLLCFLAGTDMSIKAIFSQQVLFDVRDQKEFIGDSNVIHERYHALECLFEERPRLMTMSPLYPWGKPCSRGTHDETEKNLAIFSSIINAIMMESRPRISIPWECFQFFNRIETSITITP